MYFQLVYSYLTLSTSEALGDYWDRRYRKIKIIIIIIMLSNTFTKGQR